MQVHFQMVCNVAVVSVAFTLACPLQVFAASSTTSPSPLASPVASNSNETPSTSQPIESSLLAYRAELTSAVQIATAVQHAFPDKQQRSIIIGNDKDVAAMIQLGALYTQQHILIDHLAALQNSLAQMQCGVPHPPSAASKAHTSLLQPHMLGVTSTLTDAASFINLLASVTAVTQTVTTYQQSQSANVLFTMVGGLLMGSDSVYVPSMFPPNTVTSGAALLSHSSLVQGLERLETLRNTVSELPVMSTACSNTAQTSAAISDGKTMIQAADVFVNTLLNGNPSLLQQLLPLDLTLNRFANSADTTYFLALQPLAFGGSALNSAGVLVGNRTSYSGGAVASYSLYRFDGNMMAGGIGYDYRGFVPASQIEKAVR